MSKENDNVTEHVKSFSDYAGIVALKIAVNNTGRNVDTKAIFKDIVSAWRLQTETQIETELEGEPDWMVSEVRLKSAHDLDEAEKICLESLGVK